MEKVFTDKAPRPIGPFSQAIRAGSFLFCSGQVGINPESGAIEAESVDVQARQVLTNLNAVLTAAGLSSNDVVKTTIFLTSMDDFKNVNLVYESFFGGHRPARTTVEVSCLPLGALVEVECVAIFQQ